MLKMYIGHSADVLPGSVQTFSRWRDSLYRLHFVIHSYLTVQTSFIYTVSQKNDTDVAHYNLNAH